MFMRSEIKPFKLRFEYLIEYFAAIIKDPITMWKYRKIFHDIILRNKSTVCHKTLAMPFCVYGAYE